MVVDSKRPADAVLGLAHDQLDFTSRQLAILIILGRSKRPGTVRGLAAAIPCSKPAVTRAVDRLIDAKLARRMDDPTDRRSVLLELTGPGRTFLASRFGE